METPAPRTAWKRVSIFLGVILSLPIVLTAVVFVAITVILPSQWPWPLQRPQQFIDRIAIEIIRGFLGAMYELTNPDSQTLHLAS
jgi:hypothetical protein